MVPELRYLSWHNGFFSRSLQLIRSCLSFKVSVIDFKLVCFSRFCDRLGLLNLKKIAEDMKGMAIARILPQEWVLSKLSIAPIIWGAKLREVRKKNQISIIALQYLFP